MKKEYFINLDWLRAYSAIGVLFCHAAFPFFDYWWIGVQIFFVISGFLITNILLKNREDKFYFRNFYGKRTLRIFPIYFLVLFLAIPFTLFKGYDISDLQSYFFYIQNWIIWFENWKNTIMPLLGHTWTLAIEEQFYFLWPFAVKIFKNKNLFILCGIVFLISIFARFFIFINYWGFLSAYSTISHTDTLLWWAAIAIAYNSGIKIERIFKYVLMISVVSILFYFSAHNYFQYDFFFNTRIESISYDWIFFMVVLVPFCMVIVNYLLIADNKFIEKIFRNKCIVFLWKRSYWIYLYHLPIYVLIDWFFERNWIISIVQSWIINVGIIGDLFNMSTYLAALILFLLKLSFTFWIAILSYEYIEKRILSYKYLFSQTRS